MLLMGMMCALVLGATIEGPRGSDVRVVPVESTPEPDEVNTRIVFPKNGEVKNDTQPTLQFRLEGYPLGTYSDFPRAREIRNNGEGQTLRILIDEQPYIEVNEALEDTADTEEIDFDQMIEIKSPYKLKSGIHVLQVFPARSFGESIKGSGAYAAIMFYIKEKSGKIDLSQPYLTYNQPQGEFKEGKPILLDFYLNNTQLSKDGYKVRLTIDGTDKRILTEWSPYYIYGLKKGSHTISLELLTPSDRVIPPLFNDLEKKIRVN
jgi:hypothetical protein